MSNVYDAEGKVVTGVTNRRHIRAGMIGALGQISKSRVFPQPFNGRQYVRSERKIGRNEPCPCGSGKKFKKCHLGK